MNSLLLMSSRLASCFGPLPKVEAEDGPASIHVQYCRYIDSLPNDLGAEALGLHPNAEISRKCKQVEQFFNSLNATCSMSSPLTAPELAFSDVGYEICAKILHELPEQFDLRQVAFSYSSIIGTN